MNEPDDLDQRLARGLHAPLPQAPVSLSMRLDAVVAARPAPRRFPRITLLLAPAAVVAALVGAALLPGMNVPPPASFAPGSPVPTEGSIRTPGPTWPSGRGPWTSHTVSTVQGTIVDVWALDDGFVGLIWHDESAGAAPALVASADGTSWEVVAPPMEGHRPSNGVVVDGQLHVLGYTGPFDDAQWVAHTFSLDRGWTALGPVEGIPVATHVIAMRQSDAGWVAWMSVHDPAPGGSADRVVVEIRYSADGLHWEAPPSLEFAPERYYTGLEAHAGGFIVLRYLDLVDGPGETVALLSQDGRDWSEHPLGITSGGPRFVASSGGRLVAVGSREGDEAGPAAWYSDGGSVWQRAAMPEPLADSSQLQVVIATPRGFVAVSADQAVPWFSVDGEEWRETKMFMSDIVRQPYAAAYRGDTLLVVGYEELGRPTAWVGSLSELAGS